ncbi:trk system potassium uptake protein TrkH [Paenibacillus sp. UNCCL117]|uniref:TrkH family potassium uptake protein n=1 Tax=unclassified Paenibacillus TaxID=185978 RepID=UPI000889C1F6|nr:MULTISPECIES: TrkH family potassium uptake protein [unclassified Paenibacillus]SDD00671.1 trk system potassium uptake protein TrkH [Paenibacillus sp. cl123]SFW32820.1 trk system potassium uptake protein TrkH [Paenibacillus sp. UNCCL117]
MARLFKGFKVTPPRVFALGFALIIAIGTLLLSLPAAAQSGRHTPFIDALFTATSATCVTGLAIVDTGTFYSTFGQLVILALIQLGGLGFMTTVTWFAIALRKRISLRDRIILKESLNLSGIEGVVRLILKVLLYSATIEGVAALYFSYRWSFEMPLPQAIYYGVFHAISIFNNAGFELLGGSRNLTPYVEDWGINVVSMLLILLGSIGFIVLAELVDYRHSRKLSLHSKVVLSATAVLTLVGALLIFIFEFTNTRTLGALEWDGRLLASLFQSISLRSAGVNTVDISQLRSATMFLMIIMMFIGAAPNSTGGGIKLTTFVILVGALLAMIRGKEDVVLFRHRIAKSDIYKATTFCFIGLFCVVASTMALSAVQQQDFLIILFEAVSAFGTVGLSAGLTTELTTGGKVIIIIMMYIGRVGIVTLAYALQPNPKKEPFRYPEGKLTIG